MRSKRGPVGLLVLAAALFVFALGASNAQGAFGIAKWEALTCAENEDSPENFGEIDIGFPPAPAAEQCTSETEGKWFTQAAGHPDFGITDFTLNTFSGAPFVNFPEGFIKEIVVDTPEGLGVNPEATTAKCTVEELSAEPAPTCSPLSLVGSAYLSVAAQGPPCTAPPLPVEACPVARAKLPVYNLVPFDGVPSMVGFPTSAPGEPTIIVGDLDPKDQHVRFRISDIHEPDGTEAHPPIIGSRLVFEGNKGAPFGNGTYLTMPSNCAGGQTTFLHVKSHEGGEDTASFTTAVGADECESTPFNVQLEASASGSTDSPEPASVDVQMPDQLKANTRGTSHLLTAKVTLPEGAGLNPSVANGLNACSDAQFKKGTDDPIECPAASRIGSIEVETPALDQDLGGDVYVGQPLSNDPSSGEQFRVFLHAFNDRYGVNVRLVGNVFPNLSTGQLTVVVPNNPQAPFSSFKVNVDGGPRGALTTPDTCGPHTTTARFTPWSRPGEEVPPQSGNPQFSLTTLPTGGPCPATLAERPFDPFYFAFPKGNTAGEFAPFQVRLNREDGNQEVKRIDVDLPPGMVARLKGVEYCPEASIDAAGARSGAEEIAGASCPSGSFVGTSKIDAGSGPNPFSTSGNVYLAGPYKGAPLSMVFITPAVAGPFDLGNVVVRAALHVDPETAEVSAISDAIPNVFGGVKLDIRSIDVLIDRARFTLNGTTCREPLPIRSRVYGGGGDPADPAAWQSISAEERLQLLKCKALRFKPKFYARIFGGENQTKRARNPKFRAILDARQGDANLRRAAFILPRATILDQSHIKTICTRVQLAANKCPKNAIYGHARATSPLLDKPLKGPVYLTSSSNPLPDLLVDLRGQVPIRLRGVISSQNGRLKTVFPRTPDVAVNKFILTMKGGARGLLINSRNLCARQTNGFLNLLAQNSRRQRTKSLQLNIPACRGGQQN
jgi:hypothetical protein